MDDRRFDSLVKSFATGRNRRSVLKGMLGLGAVATAGTLSSTGTNAARRPTPTPTAPKCPSGQHWNGATCACNAGTKCGSDCCTGDGVCCDNACCYGTCYGEELCCPAGSFVCDGVCRPFFEGACCTDDDCDQGSVCVDGVCQASCVDNGGSCGANSDCCSGICQAGICYATIGGTCPSNANYCAAQNATFCNGTITCFCAQDSQGNPICMDEFECRDLCEECPDGTYCSFDDSCCGPAVTCIVPCPPDGGGCFIGETRIAMADGTSRAVADIRTGDLVLGDDGAVNRVIGVEMPLLGDRPLYGFDNGLPFVTGSHPFQTDDGWRAIDSALTYRDHHMPGVTALQPGNRLVALSGVLIPAGRITAPAQHAMEIRTTPRPIASITPTQRDPSTQLYNLILDGNHTYFANELLVHNK